MTDRTCTEPGCPGKHLARGLCSKHYSRWRLTGSTADPVLWRKPENCAFTGCPNPANVPGAAKGYCHKHYGRFYRHGDPGVTLITVGNDPVCTKEDCDKPHLAKGLCGAHYAVHRVAAKPPCAVEGCELNVRAREWCNAHYRRWVMFGDVLAHIPLRGHLPQGTAWCAQCKALKPREDFPLSATRPNGLQSYCRECTKTLRSTKYKDKIYRQQRRWRQANPEVVAGYLRRYAAANPEKLRAKRARQVAANPEKYRLFARAGEANRRARERDAPGYATAKQIEARWSYFGNRCWMCGADAEVTDHVKPLAKGGSSWPANLRPACHPCNQRKRDKWPFPLEVARDPCTAGRQAA